MVEKFHIYTFSCWRGDRPTVSNSRSLENVSIQKGWSRSRVRSRMTFFKQKRHSDKPTQRKEWLFGEQERKGNSGQRKTFLYHLYSSRKSLRLIRDYIKRDEIGKHSPRMPIFICNKHKMQILPNLNSWHENKKMKKRKTTRQIGKIDVSLYRLQNLRRTYN